MKQFLTDKKFCDFKLETSDGPINCHRLVLVSSSQYFRDLLCDETKTSHCASSFDVLVLREVVAFMYNGECLIHCNTVIQMLRLSKEWEIHKLMNVCFKYMKLATNVLTACYFYEIGKQYGNNDLLRFLSFYIREHFLTLHQGGHMFDLSLESLCEIVTEDAINVKSEDIIFRAVTDLADCEYMSSDAKKRCYSLIRYEHISKNYLKDVVLNHKAMQIPPQKAMISDALTYQSNWQNMSCTKPARYWCFSRMVYVDKTSGICVYDESSASWSKSQNPIRWMDAGSSITTYDKGLVVVGAENGGIGSNRISFLEIMGSRYKEEKLQSLHQKVRNTSVVVVAGHVYVMGGVNKSQGNESSAMFRLNVSKELWRKLQSIPDRPVDFLTIHNHNFIYVLGGATRVQLYDIASEKWKRCKDMPHECSKSKCGVVVYRDKVTVVTPDQCMMYDKGHDQWKVNSYPKLGSRVQAMIYKGSIWACVADRTIYTVKHYDLDENIWTTKPEVSPKEWLASYLFYSI